MQEKIYQSHRNAMAQKRELSALQHAANQAMQPPYGVDVGGQKMTKAQ